ncbi:MAG: hypothetical protein IPK70_10475 [Flavobacteriales bacterium]|nr:hypothetical protein [Flavobacteriales bacterium]
MMRLLILSLVLASASFSRAQLGPFRPDRILLMNGQIIEARVLGQSTFEVRYEELGRNGKRKERAEPTESVFSVTDTLGKEKIWYFQDTVFGNELSIQEMRWFIKGEQDARKGYRPRFATWGGFLVGAGASIALNLEVNALFLPPIYAGAMALPRVHVTKGSLTDPYLEGEPNYAYGYAKVGRTKRVLRSLLSTAAGIAVGVSVRQFIINPSLEGYD